MKGSRDSFDRLLGWYPTWWRERNGEVFLGSMRDHAEQEGLTKPSSTDTASAIVNGTALRLDARLALWSSVVSLALGAGAWVLVLAGVGGTVSSVITAGVAPTLTLLGLVAVARARGWVGPVRALAVLPVLSLALALAALGQIAWSQGFDLADANLPLTGLAAVWLPLIATAWAIGCLGLAALLDALLYRTRMPWFGRLPLALIAATLITPLLGVGLINPVMSSAIALGVAVLAALSLHGDDAVTAPAPVTAADVRPARLPNSRRRRAAQLLAWLSAVGGSIGVAYAFTGAAWSNGATDSTVAMGQGITISLAASIPLLAAIGLMTPSHQASFLVWGPLYALALASIAVAIAYTGAPDWLEMGPWVIASAVLCGVALALWLTPRLPGQFGIRLAVGIAAGIAYAALFGLTTMPLLAFAVPVAGAIVAAVARRGRPSADSDAVSRGLPAPAETTW